MSNKPTCVMCDAPLFGRKDKRFCNIKCKNKYHAELRSSKKSLAQRTFAQILRNHRILSSYCSPSTTSYKIAKIELVRQGFDPKSVTSFERKGMKNWHHVLDFCWYLDSNDLIHVYLTEFEQSISPFVYKRLELFGPNETAKHVTKINSSV